MKSLSEKQQILVEAMRKKLLDPVQKAKNTEHGRTQILRLVKDPQKGPVLQLALTGVATERILTGFRKIKSSGSLQQAGYFGGDIVRTGEEFTAGIEVKGRTSNDTAEILHDGAWVGLQYVSADEPMAVFGTLSEIQAYFERLKSTALLFTPDQDESASYGALARLADYRVLGDKPYKTAVSLVQVGKDIAMNVASVGAAAGEGQGKTDFTEWGQGVETSLDVTQDSAEIAMANLPKAARGEKGVWDKQLAEQFLRFRVDLAPSTASEDDSGLSLAHNWRAKMQTVRINGDEQHRAVLWMSEVQDDVVRMMIHSLLGKIQDAVNVARAKATRSR